MTISKNTKTLKKRGFFSKHNALKKWLLGISGSIAFITLAVYIAFQVSPWPNALLIRHGFDQNSAKVAKALEKYVPTNITAIEDQQYRANDADAYLDTFFPNNTTTQLPTIVWVHGGAWVSGNKDDIDNYLKILASHGFTTISIGYSIAPDRQYPTPINQLNDALSYLQRQAKQFNVDSNEIILAGDSAGSQIVAQMATIITSPSYASEIGIQPKLSADKLRAMLLNCGAYDLALPDYNGAFGKFLHTVLWAYSGNQDFLHDPKLKTASVINYITPSFPPSFITAGNVDPLLEQSTEFVQKLHHLGVPTFPLFYSADHQPPLSHEYQFDLDTIDGKQSLTRMVEFATKYTHR